MKAIFVKNNFDKALEIKDPRKLYEFMKEKNIRPLYNAYLNEDDYDCFALTDIRGKIRKMDTEH